MGPFLLHLCILAVLMIPGVAMFIMEALSPAAGGVIFSKYDATKLYWLGLVGYSVVSTFIVLSLNLICRIKKTPFTKKATILSHILPVVFVWVFIQLGLHDLIQDTWQEKVKEKKNISKQVHKKTERQRPPIPRAPFSKKLIYKESGKPIEQEEQTAFQ
jgi:hypothetical protein